jgi:hypothetical protein
MLSQQNGRKIWTIALVDHIGKGYHLSFQKNDILIIEDYADREEIGYNRKQYATCRHLNTWKQGFVNLTKLKILECVEEYEE